MYSLEEGSKKRDGDDYAMVPPGFFSPEGYNCLMACVSGAFCPSYETNAPFELQSSQFLEYPECSNELDNFRGGTPYCCTNGLPPLVPPFTTNDSVPIYCVGDGNLNDPCPPGYYCPSTTELVLCPSGYFCPAGSTAPLECNGLSQCPAGSDRVSYNALGPIFVFFALCALALLGAVVARARRRHSVAGEAAPTLERNFELTPLGHQTSKSQRLGGLGLVFEDLTVTAGNGTTILRECSGKLRPGRLTAVMGNSGSGKSSLMNVLSHRAPYARIRKGQVSVTGLPPGVAASRRLFGYVPQDDVIHRGLTVQEALYYQAKLRLDAAAAGSAQVAALVGEILTLMNLTKVRDTVVGGEAGGRANISGGQLRRLSMGMELVAQPSVLFLDECTSYVRCFF